MIGETISHYKILEKVRIERENSARSLAVRWWLGYAIRAGVAETEILV